MGKIIELILLLLGFPFLVIGLILVAIFSLIENIIEIFYGQQKNKKEQ